MVQESLAGAEEHVIYARLDLLCEGTVASDTQFEVRAVVAYHIDLGSRQFVAVLFIDPTLDGLHDFRIIETVDVVVATRVAAVRTEESLIAFSLESHAEIVAL